MITSRDLDVVPRDAARALLRTAAPSRPAHEGSGSGSADRTADSLVLRRSDLSPELSRVAHELLASGHALVVDEHTGCRTPWVVGHGLRMAGYAGALNSSTVRAVVAASIVDDCTVFRLDVERLGLFLAGWVAIAAATHAFRRRGGLLQVQAAPRTRAMCRAWAPALPDEHRLVFVAA